MITSAQALGQLLGQQLSAANSYKDDFIGTEETTDINLVGLETVNLSSSITVTKKYITGNSPITLNNVEAIYHLDGNANDSVYARNGTVSGLPTPTAWYKLNNDATDASGNGYNGTASTMPTPVAWYKLNGDFTDSSGNGFNGTQSGTPTFVTGKIGQGLQQVDGALDGFGYAVGYGNRFSLGATITFWLKTSIDDTTRQRPVVVAGIITCFFESTGGNMSFYLGNSGWGNSTLVSNYITRDNNWHHYSIAIAGTNVKFYRDGSLILDSTDDKTFVTDWTGAAVELGHTGTGESVTGTFDDWRIYASQLSQVDIQKIYNNGSGMEDNISLYTTGKIGQAAWFDGVDDYINVGDLPITSTFSFTTWFKLNSLGTTQTIFFKADGGAATSPQFGLRVRTTNVLNLNLSDGTGSLDIAGTTVLSQDTWYHVAVTWNGSTATDSVKVYLNGNIEKTGTTTFTTLKDVANPGYFGDYKLSDGHSYNQKLKGLIDDARFYSVTLSTVDVQKIYNSGSGMEDNISLYTTGKIGQAAWMDGVNDTINTGISSTVGDEISIFAWVKTTASNLNSVVRQQNGSSYMSIPWNGLAILNNDGGTGGLSLGNYYDNNWHHIGFTWKRNTTNGFKTYLDGNVVAQRNSSNQGISITGSNIFIGSWVGSSELFKGLIDEVLVFSRALDATEVSALYTRGNSGSATNIEPYSEDHSVNSDIDGPYYFDGDYVSSETYYSGEGL